MTSTEPVGDVGDDTAARRTSGLRPFVKGDPRARAAGRKGGETRRANAATRSASVRATAAALDTIAATFTRDRLGDHAAAVAGWLMAQVASGAVPVRNGDEAATLLRALVDVARLESGDPTSTTVVAHVGSDAMARVVALRDAARAAIDATVSGTAVAAYDTPGHDSSSTPPT